MKPNDPLIKLHEQIYKMTERCSKHARIDQNYNLLKVTSELTTQKMSVCVLFLLFYYYFKILIIFRYSKILNAWVTNLTYENIICLILSFTDIVHLKIG